MKNIESRNFTNRALWDIFWEQICDNYIGFEIFETTPLRNSIIAKANSGYFFFLKTTTIDEKICLE